MFCIQHIYEDWGGGQGFSFALFALVLISLDLGPWFGIGSYELWFLSVVISIAYSQETWQHWCSVLVCGAQIYLHSISCIL